MSLIKVAILVLALFAFETNEIAQQRWWLSYLPPSHLKFYEPAMKTGLNNTVSVVKTNFAKTKATTVAKKSAPIVSAPVNVPVNELSKLIIAPANISNLLKPSKVQTIADPSSIMEALNSSTGNNYYFNYFFYINDTTNPENTPANTTTKEDNNVKYSIQPDCANVKRSGVYLVRVELYERPFMVYCQIINDDKYGWMVIQQRDFDDPLVDFNRNWTDYRAGFGVIHGSYWLGLEKIWAITHSMLHELVILMLDFDGNFRWYRYTAFSIADEEQNYTLNLLGMRGGTAGDSLVSSEGKKFSTYDRDNGEKCAQKMRAGWWYKDCEIGNLNSPFSKKLTANHDGVMWPSLYTEEPLRTVKMMVRAKKYKDD